MKTLADLIKEAHMVVPKINCEELAANKDDLMLIDVRESSELEETGSIDGAATINATMKTQIIKVVFLFIFKFLNSIKLQPSFLYVVINQ